MVNKYQPPSILILLSLILTSPVTLTLPVLALDGIEGISLPREFYIQKVAENKLATNIFSLTFDGNGELVVSGPGYIKRLKDVNQDKVFDRAEIVSDKINQGAQGLCFHDDFLVAVCDGGLQKFQLNENGIAEDPPRKIFDIRTGGEHHAHAIRLGPNKQWYLLAGNKTPILKEYFENKNSPVKNPRAGFLMQMDYNFDNRQIIAHGFRNAYDFDFNRDAEIFVYDSDGERDISMPWYRPTRLFRIRSGDDAGWVNESWKRPGYFFDMPEVVGDLGRGSPTGVCNYQHTQFPAAFENAIFVADWTFGRIVVFKFDEVKRTYDKGTDFAIANGEFGFAVTDMAVAPDGSLYVCVGGRGTEGGVYRISYVGETTKRLANFGQQPNSSWARKRWKRPRLFPSIADVTNDEFEQKIGQIRGTVPIMNRIQEHAFNFKMHPRSFISSVKKVESDSRCACVALRTLHLMEFQWDDNMVIGLCHFLASKDPEVQLTALELFVGRKDDIAGLNEATTQILADVLSNHCLTDFEVNKARLLIRICKDLPDAVIAAIKQDTLSPECRYLLRVARLKQKDAEVVFDALEEKLLQDPAVDQVAILRLLQLAIGDCDPHAQSGVFSGYIVNNLKFPPNKTRDDLGNAFVKAFSGEHAIEMGGVARYELMRLIGMLNLKSAALPDPSVLSNSVEDIHWLACFNLTENDKNKREKNLFVKGMLLGLVDKRRREGRDYDRNWYRHVTKLAQDLFANDSMLGWMVAVDPNYGFPEHTFLHDALWKEAQVNSSQVFAERVFEDLDSATPRQLEIALEYPGNINKSQLRKCLDVTGLRDLAILELTKEPEEQDRTAFRAGLTSLNASVVKNSLIALRVLSTKAVPGELMMAMAVSQQRGWEQRDVSIRDQAILLLQKQTKKTFGYKLKSNGINQNEILMKWVGYLEEQFPEDFSRAPIRRSNLNFEEQLNAVKWEEGDATRGEIAFEKLKCAQCHDRGASLGPKLEGITKRFSKQDLFRSIVHPNEQVPERYRATVFETVDGSIYLGTTIYESVDGITLSDSNGQTIRINKANIESRRASIKSTMPEGILNGASGQDWADLYAYLRTL